MQADRIGGSGSDEMEKLRKGLDLPERVEIVMMDAAFN
jgi:hypothetical protein